MQVSSFNKLQTFRNRGPPAQSKPTIQASNQASTEKKKSLILFYAANLIWQIIKKKKEKKNDECRSIV